MLRGPKKQNSYDDFQAATRYLVSEGYAAKDKVVIHGESNGGLLVAACVNQAPELYGAAVAGVGVLDLLHFDQWTIGYVYRTNDAAVCESERRLARSAAWIPEYGQPSDPDGFDQLLAISPLHNVNPKSTYPAMMLTTGEYVF